MKYCGAPNAEKIDLKIKFSNNFTVYMHILSIIVQRVTSGIECLPQIFFRDGLNMH